MDISVEKSIKKSNDSAKIHTVKEVLEKNTSNNAGYNFKLI